MRMFFALRREGGQDAVAGVARAVVTSRAALLIDISFSVMAACSDLKCSRCCSYHVMVTMGSGSSKGESRECITAIASHDLLAAIVARCDCANRATLRRVNQACRAAVRPAGFRVCGEQQLLELVKHALRASFFPKRLVVVRCPLTTTTAAAMYALAHHLPQRSALELELELVGDEGHRELGIDAAVALSRRVKKLTLKLEGFEYGPHDLLSLCSSVTVRQCQRIVTYCVLLYVEQLECLSLEDIDKDMLEKELGKRPAPHLTELHILSVNRSESLRTLGFPPQAQLKRISVPARWAEGQLLLDALDEPSCAGLERLCLVGDGDVVDIGDLEDVLSAGNQSFELSMQDVYLEKPTESDWQALASPALRRQVWDGAWEIHLDPADLPPSGLTVFTWPRRLRAFVQSNDWAPPTVQLFRRLLRSLRRTFPCLEVLDLRCDVRPGDWTTTVATAVQQPLAEQEEARDTLHDVIRGIRTAWPSKTVILDVGPDHGALASFFPLTPEMRWVGTSVPPSDLVVACPGLRTLVGNPRAVAEGLGSGLGAVTCLRLTAPERPRPCGYEHGQVEDVTDTLGEMSVRLELERRRDREQWWSAEDVEDLDYEVVVP